MWKNVFRKKYVAEDSTILAKFAKGNFMNGDLEKQKGESVFASELALDFLQNRGEFGLKTLSYYSWLVTKNTASVRFSESGAVIFFFKNGHRFCSLFMVKLFCWPDLDFAEMF